MLAYLGLTLAEGIVSFCDEYLSEWVGGRFVVSLRTDLFRHLHGLSLDFFDRRSLGDMISRLSNDVDEIEELMVSEVTSIITYLFQLIFFVGALFYLQWRLALVSLFVVPLFLLVARYFSRKIRRATREESRRTGSVSAVERRAYQTPRWCRRITDRSTRVSRFRAKTRELRCPDGRDPPRALFSPSSTSSSWPVLSW
jgi:ABC-type multidrug transport system fused ATPase/permease subunit